jgi:hypothetical protein
MAISHTTKWHHVNDAKISVMTADPAGGAAAYSAAIDVPGIKEIGVTPTFRNQELRGDNQKLDESSELVAIALTFRHAKLSLDVLSALLGGTVTDAGTGSTETATYDHLGATVLPYWKIEAQTTGVDLIGGDGHLIFWKCIVSAYDLGFAEENYRLFGGGARTMPRIADDKWFRIVENETLAAIS